MKDSKNISLITDDDLNNFKHYLIEKERSDATVTKYVRDVRKFLCFFGSDNVPTREHVLKYKQKLIGEYKATSVNSMLAALNHFLKYMELEHLCVKQIKVQQRSFREEDRELTRDEYKMLVQEAYSQGNEKLGLILETICSTGIRVSELNFFTVRAVREGTVQIHNKGKTRVILFPDILQKKLLHYVRKNQIENGCVFITSSGKPLDRSNIWLSMRKLGATTHVSEKKIYPHNLRHLFATVYYNMYKDVLGLADILGHTNVETTKIYTITTGQEYKRRLNHLQLNL